MRNDPDRHRKNLRMALILATIAAAFFIGIVAKFALLAH